MRLSHKLATCSIFASFVLMPTSTRAQQSIEYNTGYILGAIHVTCELEEEGFISPDIARKMIVYIRDNDGFPKRAVTQSFEILQNDSDLKSCPLYR